MKSYIASGEKPLPNDWCLLHNSSFSTRILGLHLGLYSSTIEDNIKGVSLNLCNTTGRREVFGLAAVIEKCVVGRL